MGTRGPVDPQVLARGTPGFAGADLANLVNEAALFAARGNKRLVDMEDFERAKDKIMMGAERRSMIITSNRDLDEWPPLFDDALLAGAAMDRLVGGWP